MKWPKEQTEIVLDAIRQLVDSYDYTIEEIRADCPNAMSMMYRLYNQATYDLQFDDTHPAFAEHGRKRRVRYNPEFVLYPPGCNDSHLDTLLKYVAKEIGLS